MGVDGAESPRHTVDFGGVQELGDGAWLVLGGGGLKGLAHVGAWRALTEAGVRPAGIVGTSIGALVGALAPSGMTWKEVRKLALALEKRDIVRLNRRLAWINGIRQLSVFRGEALMEYYEELLPGAGWDGMEMPFVVNAVDLTDGSTEWFGTGAHRRGRAGKPSAPGHAVTTPRPRRGERLYSALLRAYPQRVRDEHGGDTPRGAWPAARASALPHWSFWCSASA